MKIEHRYNLQTKLTPHIDNITGLIEKNFKDSIKTCYNEVHVVLTEAKGVRSGSIIRIQGPPYMGATAPENY